ncbi:hypothetical protein GEMRC1_011226 [Eukaryota sp. GEM-RC1]
MESQFNEIFTRAFVRRMLPSETMKKLGLQHVKGILLYGPPGTGKTLTARKIAEVLNCREPIKRSAPELLNKYVGESEKNVRDLFSAAEEEYATSGDDSELHVIIIDEIDAICKERGTHSDGTGVADNVINQLLSKLDGVDPLNNILVIGMTNRRDLMDKALLRPGRFEVQIEVGLPNKEGRQQILAIHTQSIADNGLLADDVDLDELLEISENYTGAELAGVVRAACDTALSRHADMKTGKISNLKQLKIYQNDFLRAFKVLPPQFGRQENFLKNFAPNGLLNYPLFEHSFKQMVDFCDSFVHGSSPVSSLLIHGPPKCGKTAIASVLADNTKIPFVKYLSPSELDTYSDGKKVTVISNTFLDAYKSPMSVVILDNLERMFNYIPLGELFSRDIVTKITNSLEKQPPIGHRVLVICTSSNERLLSRLQLPFNESLSIPLIDSDDTVKEIISQCSFISDYRQSDSMDDYLQDLKEFYGDYPLPVSYLFSDRLKKRN